MDYLSESLSEGWGIVLIGPEMRWISFSGKNFLKSRFVLAASGPRLLLEGG